MTLRISVVQTLTDFAMVSAVRTAVYIGEQHCPYMEEFDGNDFSGSLLLARWNHEPVGCARVRYFAKFIKLERLAVLSAHRGKGIARRTVEFAISLCLKKGFSRFYVHAQERLVPFWQGVGFEELDTDRVLVFSDHRYVEMLCSRQAGNALSLADNPLVINRPEGEWDRLGVLDHSALRLPTNPHENQREILDEKACSNISRSSWLAPNR
jgi:predicted GNAT family N-acyltransferase